MTKHHLEDLTEIHLSEKNISASTIKSYKIVFKKYIEYLKREDITYPRTSDVIRYRNQMKEQGYSTYYVYIHMSALKGLYLYLKMNQERFNLDPKYKYDIMTDIKNERIKPNVKKRVLTPLEAKQLLLYTKDQRKFIWDYRNHAIIYLMLTSGLSIHEITYLKLEDYQVLNDEALLYIKRKGHSENKLASKISRGANEAITDYLSRRQDHNPYLFIAHKNKMEDKPLGRMFFMTMFNKLLKDVKLDHLGITPHSLRHTAATLNLLRGASIEETKALLRHVNIKSTEKYQAYINRLRDNSELEIDSYILREEMESNYLMFYYLLTDSYHIK